MICDPLRWATMEEMRSRGRCGVRWPSTFASVHCSSATDAARAKPGPPVDRIG
jgi:hypothetical protein